MIVGISHTGLLVGPLWFSTTTGPIKMKFCTNIYGPQKMSPTDFGFLLTFPQAPPAG